MFEAGQATRLFDLLRLRKVGLGWGDRHDRVVRGRIFRRRSNIFVRLSFSVEKDFAYSKEDPNIEFQG